MESNSSLSKLKRSLKKNSFINSMLKFRQSLFDRIRKYRLLLMKSRPKMMILDVCGVCNAQCPFCPRVHMPEERSQGFMDEEVFEKSIAEAKKLDIKYIRLYSTAEPTLHPEFDKYVFRLKEEGFHVSVSTNAFTMQKHFESLSKVDVLKYSLEGWDKESYERFRYPLKYDRVRSNIIDFWNHIKDKKSRPIVNSLFLVTKGANVEEFYSCWADYMDHVNVGLLVNTVRYKNGTFVSDKNPMISEQYFESIYDGSKFCSYPFGVITVTFDGKLALCCEDYSAKMDIGNIQDGLEQWKNGAVMKSIRRQFYPFSQKTTCHQCNIFFYPSEQSVDSIRKRLDLLPSRFRNKTRGFI